MGIVIRQSIFSTIISYAGVIIGYINLLYLYPKFLSLEQVGIFRTIQDAAILFTPFAQFGLTQSIFRFYPRMVKDKSESYTFINLMMLLSLAGFSIFLIVFKIFEKDLLSYFEDNAKEIIRYSSLVIWLTLILVLTSVLEAFSRSILKNIIPNLLREVVSRLFLSALVFLYFYQILSFDQFIIGSILTYLVCLSILMFYLWYRGEFKIQSNLRNLDQEKLPELLKYSILSFAGMAGMILIGKIDSMMVSALLGLSANAIYTTAFYMATVIEIPKRALSQITMPLIARAFEQKNISEVEMIYKKTSINQFIIGCLLLIGVWANLDNIFEIMPKGNNYMIGKWVVIIVGIGKLVDMLFGPSSEIIVLSKYYKFNIILVLALALFVIVSNNLLIPIYGIEGAAAGSALTLIAFNIAKYFFIYKRYYIQPFNLSTLKVIFISGLTLFINFLIIKTENAYLDIIIRSMIISFVYIFMILLLRTSEDASRIFKSSIEYILKKN